MAGVLFVVSIPTVEYEASLTDGSLRKSTSEDSPQPFTRSKSLTSLKKSSSTISENLNDNEDVSRGSKESLGNNEKGGIVVDTVSEGRGKKCDPASKGRPHEDASKGHSKKGMTTWPKGHPLEGTMPMMKVLETVLNKLKVENASWCAGENGQHYQVFFTVATGERCEEILHHLREAGIGAKLNSVVSVIPCSLYYHGKARKAITEGSQSLESLEESTRKDSVKMTPWEKFVQSVRARLTVAQVVEGVRTDASLTFDFFALLVLAGLVAAMGLVENSTVVLVASMLISPLMGPIMAGTFGTVIRDKSLQKMGVLNELFGLLVCLVVGFFFGLAAGLSTEHWGNSAWPTEEMIARGQIRSLWVGLLIALPSGAAVAIAVLCDNVGSLVGVAISASLLPPAVNAGIFWALSCIDLVWEGRIKLQAGDGSYDGVYSHDSSVELAVLGAVSLCLTLVNIISIFLAGIVVLKIKEVAPRTSEDQEQFWKHDIKIARDYNKTFQGENAEDLQNRLAEEIARTKLQSEMNGISPPMYSQFQGLGLSPPDMFTPGFTGAYHNQRTWSPSTTRANRERKASLQDLERMYTSLSSVGPQVPPIPQHRRRRHSGGMPWIRANEMNSIGCPRPLYMSHVVDLSTLPTITENSFRVSTESTLLSTPSLHSTDLPISAAGSDSNLDGKRRFTVTPAQNSKLDV